MKTILCILSFVLLALTFVNAQTVRNEKGIKFVENDRKSEYELQGKTLVLDKMLSIGKEDGKSEEVLYNMWDLTLDNEKNIYVVERKSKCIKKFNQKGEFVLKIGRDGDGPGEFREPFRIFCTADKSIFILDQKGIISRFDCKGKFVSSFKTKPSVSDFVIDSKGNYYVNENYYSENKIWVYDKKGNIVRSFGPVNKGKNGSEAWFLNSGVMSIDDNDNIYIAFNQPYKIEKYSSDGKMLSVISKKLPFQIVEPNFTEEQRGKQFIVQQNSATRITKDLFVKNKKIYHLVKLGGDPFAYARYLDVFDMNGKYLYQLDFNTDNVRAITVDNNENIYAVIESMGVSFPGDKKPAATSLIPQIVKYKVNVKNK